MSEIKIIFEKNANGKYDYKCVKVSNENEKNVKSNIIELDAAKYSSFRNMKNFSFVSSKEEFNKDETNNIITFVVKDDFYKEMLEKCSDKDEVTAASIIKSALEEIFSKISSIDLQEHGNIMSFGVDFASNEKEYTVEDSSRIKNIIDLSKIDPATIRKKIKESVIGQDEAVDTLVNNIYNNQVLIESNVETSSNLNILLDGPSGTGKTMITKAIAREMNLPITTENMSSYTASGYEGLSLNTMLENLLRKANGNLQAAQRGIIVLDEFDKLASKGDNALEMKAAVQQELLTYLSGGVFPVTYNGKKYNFDTSKVTFIFLGAFTNLQERKISESKDGYYTVNEQDYIDEGLMKELVGRIALFSTTRDFTKEGLLKIVKNSSASPLLELQEIANLYDIDLVISDEILNKIINLAFEKNIGARALNNIFAGIKNVLLSDFLVNGRNLNVSKEETENENKKSNSRKTIEITDEVLMKSMEVEKRVDLRRTT